MKSDKIKSMEKPTSGFIVGGSKERAQVPKNYDGGLLGLKMQAKEYSTHKRPMLMSCQGDDSSKCGGGGDFGGCGGESGGGSLFCTSNNHRVGSSGDIYDVVVGAELSKSLVPFNSVSSPSFPFNSSGEMGTSMNLRARFTASQLQELERQTLIFKCMMASVAIPPELLIPITKTQLNSNPLPAQSNSSLMEVGIVGCNKDAEPWRCKRTDGKKWRCSRDVAPDQKYCERHSHKSRPRSRKPVELHKDSNFAPNTHFLSKKTHFPSEPNCHISMFPGTAASPAPSYDQPRSLEWFLRGESVPVVVNSTQEWQQHLNRESIKGGEKVYDFEGLYGQEQQQQLNPSNSYMSLGGGSHSLQAQRLNDQCSLLFSPKSSSSLGEALNQTQTHAQETRHFLDAWSTSVGDDHKTTSSEKFLPLSSLTLSMPGGSENEEENDNSQVGGFGIMGLDHRENVGDDDVLRTTQWGVISHGDGGSWMMDSTPGGPLAEALCLGTSSSSPKTASNLSSPHGTPTNTS